MINKEFMKRSTQMVGNLKLTDEELFTAIRGLELVIEYLEVSKQLIVRPLRDNPNILIGIQSR